MNIENPLRFMAPMSERLQALGLDVTDVVTGRYVSIPLDVDRTQPEMFAEFGTFDTLTVLRRSELPDAELWLYLNSQLPDFAYPLHMIRKMETVADRFYLQHEKQAPGTRLHLIIGGDMRAFSVDPIEQGETAVRGVVTVQGQIQEFAVKSWDDLPGLGDVPIGSTAQLIGTYDVRQYDGTQWVEVAL